MCSIHVPVACFRLFGPRVLSAPFGSLCVCVCVQYICVCVNAGGVRVNVYLEQSHSHQEKAHSHAGQHEYLVTTHIY